MKVFTKQRDVASNSSRQTHLSKTSLPESNKTSFNKAPKQRRVASNIKKFREAILNAFFPVRCPYCNKVIDRDEYACDECKKLFPESSNSKYAFGNYICSAPFYYDGIFSKAVKKFKFGNCGGFAKQLAFMIVQSVNEIHNGCDFDIITCVPMHKDDLKKRGYNQAELLARECAEIMNIPYVNALEKHKKNKLQHSIKASERAKNVKGVYRLTDKDIVKGKNILIIDDIITTGHTLGECCRILSKGKCKSVKCSVVCSVIFS